MKLMDILFYATGVLMVALFIYSLFVSSVLYMFAAMPWSVLLVLKIFENEKNWYKAPVKTEK